jgi:hypothetical protein
VEGYTSKEDKIMCNVLRTDRKNGQAGEDLISVVVEGGDYPQTPRWVFTFKVLGTDMPGEAVALRVLSVVREDTLEAVEPPGKAVDKATRAAANKVCEDAIEAW